MFKVRFNTEEFLNKKRRDWEAQLMNDFAIAMNGKEFICNNELDLKNRLAFIAGYCFSDENEDLCKVWNEYHHNQENFFELTDDRYNTQRLKYGMYGIAQGYVSIDKILDEINKNSFIKIPFGHFYDIRQGNFFKGCYIEISVE